MKFGTIKLRKRKLKLNNEEQLEIFIPQDTGFICGIEFLKIETLWANRVGFGLLSRLFGLAQQLRKNQCIYVPSNLTRKSRLYQEILSDYDFFDNLDIVLVNYRQLQISPQKLHFYIKQKYYSESLVKLKVAQDEDGFEKPVNFWERKNRMTVSKYGKMMIISAEEKMFQVMRRSTFLFSKITDEEIGQAGLYAHDHFDHKGENTAKSLGVTFRLWEE